MTHLITGAFAALVAASALAGCAVDPDPGPATDDPAEARDRVGHQRDGGRHERARPGRDRDGNPSRAPGGRGGRADGATGAGPDRAPGVDGTSAAPDGAGAAAAPAPSCLDDARGDPDSTGSDVPADADVLGACLQQRGTGLTLTVTAAGPVPSRTPDSDTFSSVAVEMTAASGDRVSVYLDCDRDGWTASRSRDGARRPLPAPVVSGRTVRVELPLAALGDTRAWSWRLESSWLRSGAASTSYAFDAAPETGQGQFTRR